MILANIQLTVIAGLLSECSARLDQGGTLILSGLLASESGEIRELLNRAGFRILEERLENDLALQPRNHAHDRCGDRYRHQHHAAAGDLD